LHFQYACNSSKKNFGKIGGTFLFYTLTKQQTLRKIVYHTLYCEQLARMMIGKMEEECLGKEVRASDVVVYRGQASGATPLNNYGPSEKFLPKYKIWG